MIHSRAIRTAAEILADIAASGQPDEPPDRMASNSDPDLVVSVGQVKAMLGVGWYRLETLERTGRLRPCARTHGRHRRYWRAEVEALAQQQSWRHPRALSPSPRVEAVGSRDGAVDEDPAQPPRERGS